MVIVAEIWRVLLLFTNMASYGLCKNLISDHVRVCRAFFYLTKLSAVMTGINKAVQAVSVFVASHVFFCSVDSNQCL